jgi:prepilin-type processing-associated H-X9-DG protein
MQTRLFRRSRPRCAQRQCHRRRAFTFVELLVVVLLFVLGSTFVISCARRGHHGNSRVQCASNLRQIGQAILLYSNDNRGAYPRTIASAVKEGQEPVPTWGTGAPATQPFLDRNRPADNDVTAALFLLLRTQDITSEVFVCPSTEQEKDTYGGANGAVAPIQRSNFSDHQKNLGYSYQNPYPRQKAIEAGFKLNNAIGAEFAVAADKNPGMSGGDSFAKDNVMAPTATSSARDLKQANSRNHDRDGQNILYGDGHVAWESNPFVGVNRDNIYSTADGKIAASPVDANDSILLPTDD